MTFDEWLNSQDDDIRSRLSTGALSWVKAAFEAGHDSEREACAQLAEASLMTNEDNDPWDNAIRHVAYGIRARSN